MIKSKNEKNPRRKQCYFTYLSEQKVISCIHNDFQCIYLVFKYFGNYEANSAYCSLTYSSLLELPCYILQVASSSILRREIFGFKKQ